MPLLHLHFLTSARPVYPYEGIEMACLQWIDRCSYTAVPEPWRLKHRLEVFSGYSEFKPDSHHTRDSIWSASVMDTPPYHSATILLSFGTMPRPSLDRARAVLQISRRPTNGLIAREKAVTMPVIPMNDAGQRDQSSR